MDETAWLSERFEEHRGHLRAVAYRMLGSFSDADDAVQDAWLRVARSDPDHVENLGGWLTTIVARVCLNMLRARNVRREQPIDFHVPDPVVILQAGGMQPEDEALLADSIGLALLVVLDTLAPAERLAFVLHDLFGLPFEEIAPMVERTPTAARQLASRARRRVKGAAPDAPDDRPHPPTGGGRRLLRCRSRRGLRRARWVARSGRRPAHRRGHGPSRSLDAAPGGRGGHPPSRPGSAVVVRSARACGCVPRSSTAPPGWSSSPTGGP